MSRQWAGLNRVLKTSSFLGLFNGGLSISLVALYFAFIPFPNNYSGPQPQLLDVGAILLIFPPIFLIQVLAFVCSLALLLVTTTEEQKGILGFISLIGSLPAVYFMIIGFLWVLSPH